MYDKGESITAVDCARSVKISREGSVDVFGALDRVIGNLPAEHRFKPSQLQAGKMTGGEGQNLFNKTNTFTNLHLKRRPKPRTHSPPAHEIHTKQILPWTGAMV